jgi:hypothetical protein
MTAKMATVIPTDNKVRKMKRASTLGAIVEAPGGQSGKCSIIEI